MAISTRSRSGAAPTPSARQSASETPIPARPTISKKRSNKSKQQVPSEASSVAKKLPDVILPCDDGQSRSIASLLTDETPGMILFTYPRANTPGCTTQACGLSSLAADSKKAGYVTVGASYDSVKSQASWRLKHSMQVERLLCDTLDIGLLKKIGAHKAPKSVKRCVFIIRKGGADGKDGDDPMIIESKIPISPKDCIAFVEQYIKDHPCVGGASSTEDKTQDDNASGKMDMDKEEKKDGKTAMDDAKDEKVEKKETDDKDEKKDEKDEKKVEGNDGDAN